MLAHKPSSAPRSPRAPWPAITGALILLFSLAIYICFTDLNSPSIGFRDERTHIQAVQEMRASGNWWLPTVDGSPYFHKPPFKMWLSFVPVALFGESAFSYRFIDALCGVGTALLAFALALRIWRAPFAALLAGLAVLGCSSYIFNHGVRTAVQDSMLIFLSTAALTLAWRAIELLTGDAPLNRRQFYRLAVAIGVCVGCAGLTKNIVGFMPIVILACCATLTGTLPRLLREAKGPLALLVGLALFIPSCFYVPHCLFTERACSIMFGQEVVDRATEGFHNQSDYLFYLTRLIQDRAAVPPELLVIALVWGALVAKMHRSPAHIFLLCWIVIPIVAFTIAPSRLTWYIAPTFPAMAVLIAGAFTDAVRKIRPLIQRGPVSRIAAALLSAFVVFTPLAVSEHLLVVVNKLHSLKPRIPLDLLVNDILELQNQNSSRGDILRLGAPLCALPERAYCNMLLARSVESYSVEEFAKQLETGRFGFAFIDSSFFEQLAMRTPLKGYRFLPPLYDRTKWLVALNFLDQGAPSFVETKRLIDFGSTRIEGVYGWGDRSGGETKPTFQYIEGARAAMLLAGDPGLKRLGSTIKLNLRHDLPKGTVLTVRLNEREVGKIVLAKSDYTTFDLTVPPGVWTAERNVMSFTLTDEQGAEIAEQSRKLALNFISIAIPTPAGVAPVGTK